MIPISPLIGCISVLRQMYVVKLDYYTYKCLRSIVICAYISTVWNKGHIGCLVPALKAAGVDWSAEYLMDPLQMLPAESYWHGADGLGNVSGLTDLFDLIRDDSTKALDFAAALGDSERVAELLSEPIREERGDMSPLHLAAAYGWGDVVDCLLGAGYSIASRDKEGRTPLYIAAENGHVEIVNKFLAVLKLFRADWILEEKCRKKSSFF